MNKKMLVVLATVSLTAITLTGCTAVNETVKEKPSATKTITFDSKELEGTPQWSLDKLVAGSWGVSTKQTKPAPKQTSEASEGSNPLLDQVPDDIFLWNYVKFFNSDKTCDAVATITYTPAYTEKRGDEYNSKTVLYDSVPATQNVPQNEKNVNINGLQYVTADYQMPDWDIKPYHRKAVRVLSTPVPIADGSIQSTSLGNYNVDVNKALPTLQIDMSCTTKEALTDDLWNSAVKNFVVNYTPYGVTATPDTTPTSAPKK